MKLKEEPTHGFTRDERSRGTFGSLPAALWKPALKVWFPEGFNDPDLVLLRVKPVSAEYWDSSTHKFVQFLLMAQAAFVGIPYVGEGAEHQKVAM